MVNSFFALLMLPTLMLPDPRGICFVRLKHHIWMYDLENFWLSSSGQSSKGWKTNQASHTYLRSQEFVCPGNHGWAGVEASTHPDSRALLAWDCGVTCLSPLTMLSGYFFSLSILEKQIFSFLRNAFSLTPVENSSVPFVCFLNFVCVFVSWYWTCADFCQDNIQCTAMNSRAPEWLRVCGKGLWKCPGIFQLFLVARFLYPLPLHWGISQVLLQARSDYRASLVCVLGRLVREVQFTTSEGLVFLFCETGHVRHVVGVTFNFGSWLVACFYFQPI